MNIMAGSSVQQHFSRCSSSVQATYARILEVCKGFGVVHEEAKKTSIHLVNRTAFAGISTRRESLILTFKSEFDIDSPRVIKHQQTSPNRWHLDVRLSHPNDVDEELEEWLARAFRLSG